VEWKNDGSEAVGEKSWVFREKRDEMKRAGRRAGEKKVQSIDWFGFSRAM